MRTCGLSASPPQFVTSARHDSFNISGDVVHTPKVSLEEMSGDNDTGRALVVPTPPTYQIAATASLPVSKRVEAVERHQPDVQKVSKPQSIAALLVACGLEHRVSTFEDEDYDLESLLSAFSVGSQTLMSDLQELGLGLGERRLIISHLEKTAKA